MREAGKREARMWSHLEISFNLSTWGALGCEMHHRVAPIWEPGANLLHLLPLLATGPPEKGQWGWWSKLRSKVALVTAARLWSYRQL